MAAAKISASGASTNIVFPPVLIHLLTAFNNDWLSNRDGSSIIVSRSASKTLPIQADLSSSHLPLVPPWLQICAAAFFFFSSYPAPFFVCTITCRYLALNPIASERVRACLSLVPIRQSHSLAFRYSSFPPDTLRRVLKDLRWFIRHHNSVAKSAGLKKIWVIRRSPVRFRPKPRQLKSMWIWANRPSSKGSKLLFPVIKVIKIKPDAFFRAAFSSSATWQSWWTQHEAYSSLTAYLVLLLFASFLIHLPKFCPPLAFASLLQFERILFHRLQTGVALRLFSSTCFTEGNNFSQNLWPRINVGFDISRTNADSQVESSLKGISSSSLLWK